MSDFLAAVLSTLDAARRHSAVGNYPAVLATLVPVPREQLLAEPELVCLLAWAWRNTGERDEAKEIMGWLHGAWERRGNDPVYRMTLHMRAVLRLDDGELDEAETVWGDMLRLAAEVEDHRRASRACNCLGVVADIRCRFAEAVAWYERALGASHRVGDLEGIANALHNLSISYLELGQSDRALDLNDQALRTVRAMEHEALLGNVEITRSSILLARGDLRLAEATVDRARARLARLGVRHFEPNALRRLGSLRFRQGRAAEALEHLREAVRVAESLHLPLPEADAWAELATVHAAAGEADEAERAAARAREMYRAMGAERRAARVGRPRTEDPV